jgi:hypothetical protein
LAFCQSPYFAIVSASKAGEDGGIAEGHCEERKEELKGQNSQGIATADLVVGPLFRTKLEKEDWRLVA